VHEEEPEPVQLQAAAGDPSDSSNSSSSDSSSSRSDSPSGSRTRSSHANKGQDGHPDEDECGGDPPARGAKGGGEPRPKWTRETLNPDHFDDLYRPRLCSLAQRQYDPFSTKVEYVGEMYSHPDHVPYFMTKVFVKVWDEDDGAWKVRTIHDALSPTFTLQFGVEDAARQACYYYRDLVFPAIEEDNRYFPRRRGEGPGCKMAKLQDGEGGRLAETVALTVSLNSALDRSMIDQRELCEVERLRAKVEEFERQRQEGGQLRDPPPPVYAWDNAIISSRKRHHPGCTCTRTTVDP
jgi:hypothetical protein